jgi:transposase
MSYVQGEDRGQAALLPAAIEDYVAADASVRVIDAFVDGLDVRGLGFGRSVPAVTGRPPYDPRDLLKLYLYGYLNEVRSSRRLSGVSRAPGAVSRRGPRVWLPRKPEFR